MTVLDWLKAGTRYSFDEQTFVKLAYDRDLDPDTDFSDIPIEDRQRYKDLLSADVIFTAVLLSPSNTASISESHNGYQRTIGQEQDFYQNDKIKYAISIYEKYGDERAELLSAAQRKIRFIKIEDVTSL